MSNLITITLTDGRILQSTHHAQKKVKAHNATVRWWELTKKYFPDIIIPTLYQTRQKYIQQSADEYNSKLNK